MPKELAIIWSKIEHKNKVYAGITAAVFASVISAFIPYIYGRLVDIAMKPSSQMQTILLLILLWTVLSVIKNSFSVFTSKISEFITTEMFSRLHVEISYHLLKLPMAFHKEKKMGKVVYQIIKGIDRLNSLVNETIFSFLPLIITFFVSLVVLIFVEWRLSVILIVASLLYVFITIKYTEKIIAYTKLNSRAWEKAFGERHDSVMNVDTVKATNNEIFEFKRTRVNFNSANKAYLKMMDQWFGLDKWQNFIFTFSFIAVFSIGVIMLRSNVLTPGKLIMFVGYLSLLTAPLSQLAGQYRRMNSNLVEIRKVLAYFEVKTEKDAKNAVELKSVKGDIVFKNVSFGYKKDSPIIKDISFEVRPGENIALVGASGVGKSTLISLIGRYYSPQKGDISIDGINVKKIKLDSLRSQIAIVPQEVLLFNDTIKNNIKYGNQNASEEDIVRAAKAANADAFIEKFSKKYNQMVGERGIKLSTGQKQRLAIARAVLRDPKILILDEATSALDSASEKLIQEALQKLIKGRTTFIIAHRLSTIKSADKIIVLEKGKIAEIGRHEDLMKNPDGIYRNFWELQTAIQKV